MRAIVFHGYGQQPRLVERPAPTPARGQVLVRVRATSVNPIDWKQVKGVYRPLLTARFPFVSGYDLAGEVEALGPGVTGFTKGQRVHTRLSGQGGGANAELVCAGVDVLTPMPDGMDFEQAAGLPLAGMTALQGLRDDCGLPMQGARERVLVIGASGGVGHLAVQVAKAAAAHVTGVCSARNVGLVRGLGADAVIDYTRPDAWQGVEPFDVVLDCVGGSHAGALKRLTRDGRFASCVPGPAVIARRVVNVLSKQQVAAVMLKANATDLGVLDALFAQKKLTVVIDSRFSPEQLGEAFARSESGRAAGKIVITWGGGA
ncbi:MAG: NAD(P)-dependent alcohol dehydrogenase [Myxococcaceae bacterium]|nr:NAD(P)-dependent alcohol dehydrogenase [Myxococcaceae bacterium]